MPTDSAHSSDGNDHEQKLAEHISGEHLAVLLDADPTEPLSAVLGTDRARIIMDWQREAINHGRDVFDPLTGKPDLDPWVGDVPVVPVGIGVVAEVLSDHGVDIPTRQEVRAFAESSGTTDPEIELAHARYVADPDLDALADRSAERRICGVPESIYEELTAPERAKVRAGQVIAPGQSPTAVARFLARHEFSERRRLPTRAGRGRHRLQMRTLVRIDQTWFSYDRSGAADPPRWQARTDPEWMRARLRAVLGNFWYVKIKTTTPNGIETHSYSLKWWNPDDRNLTQVENALADELSAGSGTGARELADLYGHHLGVYRRGTPVLVRNGVLNIETGEVRPSSPLWFSLTRVEADYDHTANPYADGTWLRMLRTQWPDDPDAITCLMQWFGYVVSGRNDLQKFMWVFGIKGSGKTQITTVLDALVGRTAEIGLDGLNDKWGLEDVYISGVTLGLINDSRFSPRDSSLAMNRLLAITGDEPNIRIPIKHKTEVSARLALRFHGTANGLPNLSDHTGALADRMLMLETTRSVRDTAGDVKELGKRIVATELGQVLRWAVEGLRLLNEADGRFTRTARADELSRELARALSNVDQFLADCCQIGDTSEFVTQAQLFEVWGCWATANKSGERMSKAKFIDAVKSLGYRVGQTTGAGRVVYGISSAAVTYADRDPRFGGPVRRTVTTDTTERADPMRDAS